MNHNSRENRCKLARFPPGYSAPNLVVQIFNSWLHDLNHHISFRIIKQLTNGIFSMLFYLLLFSKVVLLSCHSSFWNEA